MVKDPANDDGVVSRIIVAEQVTGASLAPTHSRPRHHAAEMTKIQFFKDPVQIVHVPFRRPNLLATSSLAN